MRINPTDEIRMVVAGKVEVFTAKELAEELRALLAPDLDTPQGMEQMLLSIDAPKERAKTVEQRTPITDWPNRETRCFAVYRLLPDDLRYVRSSGLSASLSRLAPVRQRTVVNDIRVLCIAGLVARNMPHGKLVRRTRNVSDEEFERIVKSTLIEKAALIGYRKED